MESRPGLPFLGAGVLVVGRAGVMGARGTLAQLQCSFPGRQFEPGKERVGFSLPCQPRSQPACTYLSVCGGSTRSRQHCHAYESVQPRHIAEYQARLPPLKRLARGPSRWGQHVGWRAPTQLRLPDCCRDCSCPPPHALACFRISVVLSSSWDKLLQGMPLLQATELWL